MSIRHVVIVWGALVAAGAVNPPTARGQNGPALIRQGIGAYNDFDPRRALPLLQRGVDPAAGPQDSLWALGVQYLAQILHEQGDETGARAWAHWAVRLDPDLELDSLNLLTDVINEFRRARGATAPQPDDARVTAQWVWPETDPGRGPGRIEVRSGEQGIAVQATLSGRGEVQGRATLPAGTYEVVARAPGRRTARVTREVLPGITTILTFALEPAGLTADARRRVRERIAALLATRFGAAEPGCAAATLVADGGLLLTTYRAIRGAERVTLGGTAGGELAVAAYDPQRDLAVLRVSVLSAGGLPIAPEPADTQAAWGFGFARCDSVTEARVRLAAGATGPVRRLDGAIPAAQAGSPLVDSTGALVGLFRDDSSAVPAAVAADLIGRARASIASGKLLSPADVAAAERHRYGVVTVTASPGVTGSAAVTPQEPWHWPELAVQGDLPLRFAGPEGRYRLVATVAGVTRHDSVVVVAPGIGRAIVIPPPVAARKKGGFPWVLAVLGAAGAGTAALLLMQGDEPPTTGSISISVPNP